MLGFSYSEATAKRRFTLVYRGYDLEVTRELSRLESARSTQEPRSAYLGRQ